MESPAIKGLSSTALANAPTWPLPYLIAQLFPLMIRPISATAVMLIPDLVEPILTDEQTLSVSAKRGMELIRISSPFDNLLYQGRETTNKINTDLLGSLIKSLCQNKIVRRISRCPN